MFMNYINWKKTNDVDNVEDNYQFTEQLKIKEI